MAFFKFDKSDLPEQFRDVACKSLDGETVRVNRLTAVQLLPILAQRDTFARGEDGKLANDEDALTFSVELVAVSSTDDKGNYLFDSPEGREFLRGSLAVFELFNVAVELNGLATKQAKKKRRSRR